MGNKHLILFLVFFSSLIIQSCSNSLNSNKEQTKEICIPGYTCQSSESLTIGLKRSAVDRSRIKLFVKINGDTSMDAEVVNYFHHRFINDIQIQEENRKLEVADFFVENSLDPMMTFYGEIKVEESNKNLTIRINYSKNRNFEYVL